MVREVRFPMGKRVYKDLIISVLKENKRPIHYKEITAEILKYRTLRGKTPDMAILSILVKDKNNFIRTDSGI